MEIVIKELSMRSIETTTVCDNYKTFIMGEFNASFELYFAGGVKLNGNYLYQKEMKLEELEIEIKRLIVNGLSEED